MSYGDAEQNFNLSNECSFQREIVIHLSVAEAVELFHRALASDATDTEDSVSALRKLSKVIGSVHPDEIRSPSP